MSWEVYNRKDGLVYTLCDGYKDFLHEPSSPEVYTDRFWPWFPLIINEIDHETHVFPPSDVKLIRDMQMEYNRSRQGMREHRRAARPKTVVASGMVDQEDLEKLSNHPDNAIIELNGLQPGQKVDDLLQAFRGPPIDPNLYEGRADVHRHDARVWNSGREHRGHGGFSFGHAIQYRRSVTRYRDGLQHR